MNKNLFSWMGVLFILLMTASPLRAGQVINDQDRSWARNALKQEQSIQPAPNTVAVLYFQNRSGQQQLDPLQKGFACLLMTDLASVENLHLVERARLQALVEELDLGASGIVQQESAPRVGKLLGASYLVGGDIRGQGPEQIGIDADLLKVSDQNSLGRPSAEGEPAQVLNMEKKILFGLIELLKIQLRPGQKEQLEKPATRDLQTFFLFSLGIDASDRGNYTGAAEYYQKSLARDPQFKPAMDALAELLRLGLAQTRSQALLEEMAEQNSSTLSLEDNIASFRRFKPVPTGDARVRW